MRWLAPCLTVLAIVGAAVAIAIYQADHPPPQIPTAPNRILHIADLHYFPEYDAADRALVERIQQQQMDAIRVEDVREVWVEGQSDQTIDEFRQHVLRLRRVEPPDPNSENPVDQLIAEMYHEDLLLMGAAGRLLMAGEIDDVLPLEDHAEWSAVTPEGNHDARERAMAKRLPARAVIVLGADHDLRKWLPAEWDYQVVRVKALP